MATCVAIKPSWWTYFSRTRAPNTNGECHCLWSLWYSGAEVRTIVTNTNYKCINFDDGCWIVTKTVSSQQECTTLQRIDPVTVSDRFLYRLSLDTAKPDSEEGCPNARPEKHCVHLCLSIMWIILGLPLLIGILMLYYLEVVLAHPSHNHSNMIIICTSY